MGIIIIGSGTPKRSAAVAAERLAKKIEEKYGVRPINGFEQEKTEEEPKQRYVVADAKSTSVYNSVTHLIFPIDGFPFEDIYKLKLMAEQVVKFFPKEDPFVGIDCDDLDFYYCENCKESEGMYYKDIKGDLEQEYGEHLNYQELIDRCTLRVFANGQVTFSGYAENSNDEYYCHMEYEKVMQIARETGYKNF